MGMISNVNIQTKERPILFSGAMVKAILDGRKTQTRRLVNPQPSNGAVIRPDGEVWEGLLANKHRRCPHGAVGDRLWVRESIWLHGGITTDADGERRFESDRKCEYVADHATSPETKYFYEVWAKRPSIFMPRWASRITLEITGVRVERVQDISPDDCLAEGIAYADCDPANAHQYWREEARAKYRELWDSINAKRGYGWDANPWVWVVEFKRI